MRSPSGSPTARPAAQTALNVIAPIGQRLDDARVNFVSCVSGFQGGPLSPCARRIRLARWLTNDWTPNA